jgi:arsenical pump membrane protein
MIRGGIQPRGHWSTVLGRWIGPAAGAAAALVVTRPLGPLAGTMLLVLVLPPLAAALEVLGWAGIVAAAIQRARLSWRAEVVATYGLWTVVSATLTLDVAAVVAVPVELRLAAGHSRQAAAAQVFGAILGANVGSLLFPFSNLTNLVLVAATGTAFGAYVGAALWPQLLAIAGTALLLGVRARATQDEPLKVEPEAADAALDRATVPRATVVGGLAAAAGAVAAIVVGLAGGDVAVVFAVTAAVVVTCAEVSGRPGAGASDVLRSIPPVAVAVVLFAAVAGGPASGLASAFPSPQASLSPELALLVIALVGGALAAAINNLPAAAFGAIWLHGASPDAVVAYLIGTNLLAIATPHGSVATMLVRRLAARGGFETGVLDHLTSAWLPALAAGVPAMLALLVVR